MKGNETDRATKQSLPFQKVKHEYGPPDAQPTANGGIVILVTGQLIVSDVREAEAQDPWYLTSRTGRRRVPSSWLLPGLPALPGPLRPVVCLQRHLQARPSLSEQEVDVCDNML